MQAGTGTPTQHPASLHAAGGVFCVDVVTPSLKQAALLSFHLRFSLMESLNKHFQNWCGLEECKGSGKSRALLKMSEQSRVVKSSRVCVYVCILRPEGAGQTSVSVTFSQLCFAFPACCLSLSVRGLPLPSR